MKTRLVTFIIIFILASLQSNAEIILPGLVADNMVLQRDIPVKIWGWAGHGEKIRVTFKAKSYHTTSNAEGKWFILLIASKAGGPYQMELKGTNTILLKNILIGDVWLCAGQSNMEYNISEGINNQEAEIAAANYPVIRVIKIGHQMSLLPGQDITTEGWQNVTPATVSHFSATAYFFGRELYNKYKVPLGLITAAWGGTPIEAWVDCNALKQVSAYYKEVTEQQELANNPKGYAQKEMDRYLPWVDGINKMDKGFTDGTASWAKPTIATDDWKTIAAPGFWEEQGFPGFDGIAWLRKDVILPPSFTKKDLQLSIGMVDDNDFTYFNGVLVGHTEGYNVPRKYIIPAALVKEGINLIAVRVFDNGGGGGLYGAKDSFNITDGNQTISIAGEWKMKTAVDVAALPPYPGGAKRWYQFGGMYNGMIVPTENYTIRGITWYQGETNVRNPDQYKQLFPLMIAHWRKNRSNAQLPFLYVQLPNIASTSEYRVHDTAWAPLRDAQLRALSSPNTGMAVIIDDEGKSLHPHNKQLPGKRLALLAYKIAYHEKIVATGPLYKSAVVKNNSVVLSFSETGTGLKIKNGAPLKGFEIAGDDKIFLPAIAFIVNNQVVVKSNGVKVPKAVRYDWANDPDGNLYNKEGFPASPFRTVDW